MKAKPVITSAQLLLMAVGSALMFPYTFMPILTAPPANQDVWVVLIASFLYVLIINAPILIIINKFRGFSINEMTEMLLGKFLGKAVVLLFVAFFLFCYISCMQIGVIFISMSILPGTPVWAILVFAFAGATYVAYKGAGTIGRLATFLVPFIMFTVVFFFLMGLSMMDIKILQPVLAESSLSEVNLGAFYTGSRYSEILIFLVFSFFLAEKARLNKTYAMALGIFAIFFFLIVIPTILVLGVDLAKMEFNPYFVYTRQVHAYDFIQRVQSINTLAWFPGLLLKLSIYCFMASHALSGVFKAKSHKGFVPVITGLAFSVCMIPMMQKSSVMMFLASDKVFPFIILPFTFFLPLFFLIAYFIKRKKLNKILERRKADAAQTESSLVKED